MWPWHTEAAAAECFGMTTTTERANEYTLTGGLLWSTFGRCIAPGSTLSHGAKN